MRIFVLITLSLAAMAYGQVIPHGKFCASLEFTGMCIDFKDSSRFLLRSGSCFNSYAGQGIYKIRKDSLTLYFEAATGLKINRFEIMEENNVAGKTMVVDVQMFYGDSLLPTYAPLIITTEADEANQKTIVGMMTDSLGKAKILLDSRYGMVRLICKEVGAVPFYITLDRNKNYMINGYLTQNKTSAIEFTTWKYKIISTKANQLILQRGTAENIDIWNFGTRK